MSFIRFSVYFFYLDNIFVFTAVTKELPRTKSVQTMMILWCENTVVWLVHNPFNAHLYSANTIHFY